MAKLDRLGWADGICFTSYGLRIGIRVNEPEVLARLPDHLPPGWKPARSPIVDRLYSLRAATTGRSTAIRNFSLLYAGPARLARTKELAELFEPLESDLQMYVAEWARRRVFVHAGVVGWGGQAIVIPGRSFSGKTTLVTPLTNEDLGLAGGSLAANRGFTTTGSGSSSGGSYNIGTGSLLGALFGGNSGTDGTTGASGAAAGGSHCCQ